jgi:hypothetical protein
MILLKVYFTISIVLVIIAGISSLLLMNGGKNENLWYKTAKISLLTLLVLWVIGALCAIWN